MVKERDNGGGSGGDGNDDDDDDVCVKRPCMSARARIGCTEGSTKSEGTMG